jgi:L-arabinose transport system ATP-binding protein
MGSVLEFQNISKYFPGVKALDQVSFQAYSGEILAFLGENGAGKSTLLKVLNGDYQPSGGKYLLDGVEKHFQSPHEAIEEGISVYIRSVRFFWNYPWQRIFIWGECL